MLLPNSIILPDVLRKEFVVVVNEYPPTGFPTGHVDITFFDHGQFQGTFGRNSEGTDISGRVHKRGQMDLTTFSMPGGVFTEGNAHAMAHFVIVSGANYRSMIAFAKSQASLTVQGKMDYNIVSGNCADFIYQIFQHSDLPPQYRRITYYLKDLREPVAIYAVEDGAMYQPGSEKWSEKRKELERGLVTYRVYRILHGLSIIP